jgi:hypothetical protein
MHSDAHVATGKPAIYMQQLCAHFSHRLQTEVADDRASIQFPLGLCTMDTAPEVLNLHVQAEDEASLTRLEEVVASHLVRFGYRDELQVNWERQPE